MSMVCSPTTCSICSLGSAMFLNSYVISPNISFIYVAELTNARVAWFSIGALATSIFMAGLQIWNLRKFFIRKKIL